MTCTGLRSLSGLAFTIAVALALTARIQAALVELPSPTPATPGVALDLFTGQLSGTVLATMSSSFADNALPNPFATGTLYSLVVDRGGGLLDFYYQLVNTTDVPTDDPDDTTEFYRLKTTGGFGTSLVISVGQTDSLSGLVAGNSDFDANQYRPGDKPAATADRDVATVGSVGFYFPVQPPQPFIGDAANIAPDQASAYLVVRTDATQYGLVNVRINGAATAEAMAFAPTPVPEPASLAIGVAGLSLGWNLRRQRASSPRIRKQG